MGRTQGERAARRRCLGPLTETRDNNFNLMRLVAAAAVLVSHSFSVAGRAEPIFGGLSAGEIAVDVFFVTSGLLVTRSLFTHRSTGRFVRARVLRIYPALVVATLVIALVIGTLQTERSVSGYVTDADTLRFIATDATLVAKHIEYFLPGVFEANPVRGVVNLSLWTLPWEIRAYASLAVLGLATRRLPGRMRTRASEGAIVALGVSGSIVFFAKFHGSWEYSGFTGEGIRLVPMFFIGAALYVLRDRIVLDARVGAVVAGLLVATSQHHAVFLPLYLVGLPYLVLVLAYLPGGPLRRSRSIGDYSYGMYVYAYPVQQLVVDRRPTIGVAGVIVIAGVITFTLSYASWHLVERPMLQRK